MRRTWLHAGSGGAFCAFLYLRGAARRRRVRIYHRDIEERPERGRARARTERGDCRVRRLACRLRPEGADRVRDERIVLLDCVDAAGAGVDGQPREQAVRP